MERGKGTRTIHKYMYPRRKVKVYCAVLFIYQPNQDFVVSLITVGIWL